MTCLHCNDAGWLWRHELPDTSDWDGSADDTRYSCPYCERYRWPSDDRSQAAVDAAIASWHASHSELDLAEWLGWSAEEYQRFVEDGAVPQVKRLVRDPLFAAHMATARWTP